MGQTMSPHSDLVDASVPNEWIGAFIGHHIWSRPEAKPGAHADWVELLDVWEEETGDPTYPHRFRAWIWWRGKAWVSVIAKLVHTRGIPAGECTFLEWDRDGETVRYHTWTPPIDDPPVLKTRPPGWEPPQPRRAPDPLPTIVPTECGDQFALPI